MKSVLNQLSNGDIQHDSMRSVLENVIAILNHVISEISIENPTNMSLDTMKIYMMATIIMPKYHSRQITMDVLY